MREPRKGKEQEIRRDGEEEQGKGKPHRETHNTNRPIIPDSCFTFCWSSVQLEVLTRTTTSTTSNRKNGLQQEQQTGKSRVKLSCGRRVSGARRPGLENRRPTRAIRQQADSLHRYMMLHISRHSVHKDAILPPQIYNMAYLSMVMYDLVTILFAKVLFHE